MNMQIIDGPLNEQQLRMLKEFMLSQPQYYPNYGDWLDRKCLPRIKNKEYKSIIAISKRLVVGDAVYRELAENRIEIKNFRMDPEYQNRGLGHFLMSQIRFENPGKILTLDVTVDNFRGVEFFIRNSFNIKEKKQLYVAGQNEYLMERVP